MAILSNIIPKKLVSKPVAKTLSIAAPCKVYDLLKLQRWELNLDPRKIEYIQHAKYFEMFHTNDK